MQQGMPALVLSRAPPRGYQPGVFFGFIVAIDISLFNEIDPTRIIPVDDVQQLFDAVLHGFMILAPRFMSACSCRDSSTGGDHRSIRAPPEADETMNRRDRRALHRSAMDCHNINTNDVYTGSTQVQTPEKRHT
ncbi:hypothetical protein [Sorangium cellulosum]|uniref:hypothetical protein n=1 Tax=Sorangium cellulosum TaxID=56 RepID=UPI0012DB106D|nr:hypothetical protein [Sorangium cellulosum]